MTRKPRPGRREGLYPIHPVAIPRHPNLPGSTQVIDREKHLVPRELRTEWHHLCQGTAGAELLQRSVHAHLDRREFHRTPLFL
jgi:hypothetical protein